MSVTLDRFVSAVPVENVVSAGLVVPALETGHGSVELLCVVDRGARVELLEIPPVTPDDPSGDESTMPSRCFAPATVFPAPVLSQSAVSRVRLLSVLAGECDSVVAGTIVKSAGWGLS
jgi:hypothetical protein